MAITSEQVTVGATETALNTSTQKWTKLTIRNSHATDALHIGPTGVATTSYGIAAGGVLTVDVPPGTVLYGLRGASNNITAHVLRTN